MACFWVRMRPLKFKYFAFVLGLLAIYLILGYNLFEKKTEVNNISFVNLKHIVVHIDLKGAPPRLQYLERLLPLFIKHKVNGILMEYEDMFPYEGKLVNISSRNSYDKTELKNFLLKAKELQIEVIPLIQTIGHMEHVLKLKEFRHLREVDTFPDSICPSNDESIKLIKQMLEQVINFHREVTTLKHIHIGGDEVFHMNKCQKCRTRRISKSGIFINHVHTLSDIIFQLSPHTRILIWHDMFRGIKKYRWKKEIIRDLKNVAPVYWDYTTNPDVSYADLYQYHKIFNNIWIATAFKGADGRQAALPDFKNRFLNHYSWMRVIVDYIFAGEKKKFDFKGIILTGWSRYSHMDPLCELLPITIPSLILNLRLIQKFIEGVNINDKLLDSEDFFVKYIASDFYHAFNCQDSFIDIDDLERLSDSCTFESKILFSLLRQYKGMELEIEAAFNDEELGLPSIEYYSKMKNLNMNEVNKTRFMSATHLRELLSWQNRLSKEMSKFFENFVIDEYVEVKLYSLKKKVTDTLKLLEDYMETHTWKRRPYNFANV